MSKHSGGCHCGAIRYDIEGEALTHALCHCTDCRRHAGAPMVGWTMYPQTAVRLTDQSLLTQLGVQEPIPIAGIQLQYRPMPLQLVLHLGATM